MTEESDTVTQNIIPTQDKLNTNKFKKSPSNFNLKASNKINLNTSKSKIVKGATSMTQTGSQKVMES